MYFIPPLELEVWDSKYGGNRVLLAWDMQVPWETRSLVAPRPLCLGCRGKGGVHLTWSRGRGPFSGEVTVRLQLHCWNMVFPGKVFSSQNRNHSFLFVRKF